MSDTSYAFNCRLCQNNSLRHEDTDRICCEKLRTIRGIICPDGDVLRCSEYKEAEE